MAKIRKINRKKAEEVVRKMLRRKYPTIELALDELAESHLYGDSGTLLEALVEVARTAVIDMIAKKSVFLGKTLAHIEEKVREAGQTKQKKGT